MDPEEITRFHPSQNKEIEPFLAKFPLRTEFGVLDIGKASDKSRDFIYYPCPILSPNLLHSLAQLALGNTALLSSVTDHLVRCWVIACTNRVNRCESAPGKTDRKSNWKDSA